MFETGCNERLVVMKVYKGHVIWDIHWQRALYIQRGEWMAVDEVLSRSRRAARSTLRNSANITLPLRDP